jgi:phosphoglycolate phosphatase-like HAD superfamily hydrolase
MVAHPKPAGDSLLLALERLGEPIDSAVMVGDTVNDMRAGKDAGTRIAAVTWGAGKVPDLLGCAPDLVLNHPDDLSRLPEMVLSLDPAPTSKR